MASPKHKTRTPTQKPIKIGPGLSALAPAVQQPPTDGNQEADQGGRIALVMWLLAFLFLGTLLLWDLLTAILFR
jgi:hypothetical protein